LKAVVIRETGDIIKLFYKEVDTPSAGPDEVVMRLKATGFNHFDYDIRERIAGFPTQVPHVPGIEGSGEGAEIGYRVTGVAIDGRVSISVPCRGV